MTYLTGRSESTINIEQTDGVLDGTILQRGVAGGHLDCLSVMVCAIEGMYKECDDRIEIQDTSHKVVVVVVVQM